MNILIISLLAGISTIIGCFPIYFPYSYHNRIIGYSLSLSSGIMLSISILSLIPESLSYLKGLNTIPSLLIFGIFFLLGILSSKTIDKIVTLKENTKLYQIGIISMITLIIHNIPEGIISYLTTTSNFRLGISLTFAIAIHNIPEGIAISIPIYYATRSHRKAIQYTAISGLSEFVGAVIACIFIKNHITPHLLMSILAMTSGIMIDISLTELLPEAKEYISLKERIICFLLGFIIMFICIYLFQI